ncbi:DMT family transporter [Fictibacillus sp. KU28468]|uniref:DMT family transporter n=1 Tax=Fictibacillus sp. KU28468 TaxID=2991053 RepID=UPI0006A7ED8E|nr:DMT family transporter [Fictibacillus sp. KU28468]UZJ77725.1 DMT family transporter [Fictibacillus sp. KU28468]SFE79567.1 transporter family-2 protein [Bacillus sp. OV194]
MLLGIIFALIAGALVGLQNIFNSKVNEHAGSWATNVLVLGLGFIASLTLGLIFEGKQLFHLHHMQTWYWFSGVIGVGVVTCVVQGVKRLRPTIAISIVLASQLGFALFLDSVGALGLDPVPFTFKELIGVLIIIGGIIVFKFSGEQETQQSQKAS